ncbi:hypothetical protein RHGRI_022618 [Rhododendron griersonianum]|uniref:Protein FAR1-RELATED SEQUENCE n=1 Tax=Rhododendron griersonianum TaxID=479676 RepID=A0AAV6J762_9ERIC|nr:hypothetical protein RHGRI_022618 [Rhododendron griersonianum]
MAFNTSEDAYRYYLRYTRDKGFAIAKRSSRKGSDGKLRHEVEKIAVGHGFGTQESVVNVHGHPNYMGHLMWANMMPHNIQANMTQDRTIFPFSPILCPTKTSLNQVWRGQSILAGSQSWGGQSSFMKDQGQY